VWKATVPNVDIRTWQPGANYSSTNRSYQTPAQEHQVAASVSVPADLATGQYLVGLSILEPMSRTPGVFFAVTNFFKQSQSQPLCRIGIGTNASSHSLTGVFFDNLVNDDTRYYTMTAQGPTYTLTTSATNGSIALNPPGGIYNTGTVVTVTATPNTGWMFTNWSGNLTGSTNPATITMDGNKTVMANFAVRSASTSFRVNCGGAAYTAAGGIVFEADGTYNNGGSTFSTVSAISGTTDDPLYQTERWGNSFGYSIPMVNGDYEVTLMFAEINFNSAGRRVFNVAIEGTQVITNLDIWAKVGMNAAYNKTNVVTVSDGQLNIAFSPVVENPKISAIQVQRIAGPAPHIQPPVLQGGQLRLEWVGGGTLQTATNMAGSWSDVLGAVSPYLAPASNSAQFFRVKQ
jgi:hypothetical protein